MGDDRGDLDDGPKGPAGLTRLVLRGAAATGFGYGITVVANLGFSLVLARVLDPAEIGQFAAATILLGLGLLVSHSGMTAALIHREDRIEEAAASAVFATTFTGLGLSLIALALAPAFGEIFHDSTVRDLAAASSGVLFLRSLSIVPNALLQRRFNYVRRMIAEPLGAIVYGVVAVYFAKRGDGVWSLVYAAYTATVLDLFISWIVARWRPQLRLASFRTWRELANYGRHVFIAAAVLDVGDQLPTVIVGRFLGAAPLGLYRYAARMAYTPFGLLLAAGSYVLFPALARIASEKDRFRAAFLRALRFMAVAAMPSALILIPLGEPSATLIFGPKWTSAGHAAMALCMLTAGRALDAVFSEALKAAGRPQELTRLHVLEVVIAGVAMMLLYPYGLNAVAAGMSIGAVSGAIYASVKTSRVLVLPMRDIVAAILPQFICAAISSGIVLIAEIGFVHASSRGQFEGLLWLAGEFVAGFAIYAALLIMFVPKLVAEIRYTISNARKGAQQDDQPELPDESMLQPEGPDEVLWRS